jgi:hypothetical protein
LTAANPLRADLIPQPSTLTLYFSMHSTAMVLEIDRLLRAGELSHRKIAARLGVSRGTVSAIASGRRGLYGKDSFERVAPTLPSSPPARCKHCGYRVYQPCRICQARKRRWLLMERSSTLSY